MNSINTVNHPPATESARSETPLTLPHSPVLRRNQVLYVRVTSEEKEVIVKQATQANLSVSRYLTRFALDGTSPLPAVEKKRLENLISLFKRAEIGVNHVWADANSHQLLSCMPGIEEDFAVATQTLSGLIRELTKRL